MSRTLWIGLAALVAPMVGCAQSPELTHLESRGGQCSLLVRALNVPFVLEQPEAEARRQEAVNLLKPPLSDAYPRLRPQITNRKSALEIMDAVGPSCAALFPETTAKAQQCLSRWSFAYMVAVMKEKERPSGEALLSLQMISPETSEGERREMVDYFYGLPAGFYRQPLAMTRSTGGWLDSCITGKKS